MAPRLYRNSALLVLACLLSFVSTIRVDAAVIDTVDTNFDVEFFDNRDDVFLNSTVTCTVGSCRITYSMRNTIVDSLLRVVWRDRNGGVLINGGNGFGFINTWIKLDTEWGGVFLPNPSAVRVVGEADFTGSQVTKLPCLAGRMCPATYHDWAHNVPPGAVVGGPGASPAHIGNGASTDHLPPGLESITSTTTSLASLVPDPLAPTDLEQATATPLFDVSSEYEAVSDGFRYLYTVTNHSNDDVEFEIPLLGIAGVLAALETSEHEVHSANGPKLLDTEVSFARSGFIGSYLGGRFQALTPVPLPPAILFMLSAVVGLFSFRRLALTSSDTC